MQKVKIQKLQFALTSLHNLQKKLNNNNNKKNKKASNSDNKSKQENANVDI